MASSNPARFLTHDAVDRGLALKFFWGRVIEAFRAKTIMWDNTGNIIAFKMINEGYSWAWPIIGDDLDPEYHTPGDELLGQTVTLDEGTITIDDILVSHLDVPLDHRIMSHFDIMGPFATKLGRGLAINLDRKLHRLGVNAARTALVSGIHPGGQQQLATTAGDITTAYPVSTDGATHLYNDIGALAELFDNDYVPEDGRFLFISPYLRRVLGMNTNIFNKDYSTDFPNDLLKRLIGVVHGFNVMPSTAIPYADLATGPTQYQGTYAYSDNVTRRPFAIALCGVREGQAGIGFVQGIPITAHMHDDERRNTTFMKAQMMGGGGVLCPWCAGVLDSKWSGD